MVSRLFQPRGTLFCRDVEQVASSSLPDLGRASTSTNVRVDDPHPRFVASSSEISPAGSSHGATLKRKSDSTVDATPKHCKRRFVAPLDVPTLPRLQSGRPAAPPLVVAAATIQIQSISAFHLAPEASSTLSQSAASSQATVTKSASP